MSIWLHLYISTQNVSFIAMNTHIIPKNKFTLFRKPKYSVKAEEVRAMDRKFFFWNFRSAVYLCNTTHPFSSLALSCDLEFLMHASWRTSGVRSRAEQHVVYTRLVRIGCAVLNQG